MLFFSDSDFDVNFQACPHNYSEDKIHCEDVERNIQEIIWGIGVGKEFFSLPVVSGQIQTKNIKSF